MQFARDHGMEHLMLEATMAVNDRLERAVPAAASPDKIDEALAAAAARRADDQTEELAIELGA
jgi:hypothetical protein